MKTVGANNNNDNHCDYHPKNMSSIHKPLARDARPGSAAVILPWQAQKKSSSTEASSTKDALPVGEIILTQLRSSAGERFHRGSISTNINKQKTGWLAGPHLGTKTSAGRGSELKDCRIYPAERHITNVTPSDRDAFKCSRKCRRIKHRSLADEPSSHGSTVFITIETYNISSVLYTKHKYSMF